MIDFEKYDLYILDMDGTLYIENKLIDGAAEFINKLREKRKKYLFLTNNSSVNKNDYIKKLNKLGIPCTENNIFSSGMAAGIFISEKRIGKSVFLVGTKALKRELNRYGIKITNKNPDIVLVGFDRELCYNKVEKACKFLFDGAEFIATNPDLLYPIKNNRFIPDCGSICHMLITATNKKPIYIGKPNSYMINLIIEKYGIIKEKTLLIGDRLYTDIAAGINTGVDTILVLSGETNLAMLENSNYQPSSVLPSIKNLIEKL